MEKCKLCPSYALNEHRESGLCDVCYQKQEVAKLQARVQELESWLKEIEGKLARETSLRETAEAERDGGWHLAGDAARGLNVECDGDLGHEAAQIKSERDALRTENDALLAAMVRIRNMQIVETLPIIDAVFAQYQHITLAKPEGGA